jgi:hypothetical protein
MAQPNLQKPGPRTAPPAWEATPWIPQERTVEEPQISAEPALQLSDEHVVDVPLAGDSIVAAD